MRIFTKLWIEAVISISLTFSTVLTSVTSDHKKVRLSEETPKFNKVSLLPVVWTGPSLKHLDVLGNPQVPDHPNSDEAPIHLQINDAPLLQPNDNPSNRKGYSKDLKTANSLRYYSYWNWPYHCSYYWPYYCYGYGYGHKYLPHYTSFWGKWNRYYAYPYYNYYDNYYNDFWYKR